MFEFDQNLTARFLSSSSRPVIYSLEVGITTYTGASRKTTHEDSKDLEMLEITE